MEPPLLLGFASLEELQRSEGVCGSGPACLIGCDARSMHRRPERDRPAWAMGGGTRQRHRRCLARVALGRRGCAAQAPQARLQRTALRGDSTVVHTDTVVGTARLFSLHYSR